MDKNINLKKIKSIHFIGVGGISMSGLAKWCLNRGLAVSGSDFKQSNILKELQNLGAKIYASHSEGNLSSPDLVVYTSAISYDNKELQYALQNGLPLIKRSELLELILKEYKNTVCVCGSHGKTTVTAMVTTVLEDANLNPTAFIGGIDKRFGNYKDGGGDYFVAEACEYKKNFLDLTPKSVIVLNIDNDHMDTYKNEHNMICAFEHFILNKFAVINYDDEKCRTLVCEDKVTFGLKKGATYRAKYVKRSGDGYAFSVYRNKQKMGRISLQIIGKHNVYNALAVTAFALEKGIPFESIKNSLESFKGVKRRGEYLGKLFNLKTFADYAHHPKEIKETLSAFNYGFEKSIVVFQPHTYSRTKLLLKEFKLVFDKCKKLIIYKTYPARERYLKSGSAKRLYENIENKKGKKYYAKSKNQLVERIEKLKKGAKRIIFIGAGDIYEIATSFFEK